MSDKDLESFDLNLENSDFDNNSDEDDETHYEFEVKKFQEKYDFKIENGFKV
jgi:hypothetical protein